MTSPTLHKIMASLLCAFTVCAQSAPDSSKANSVDQKTNAVTAGQQKESKADRELARKIRQAVVKDKSLSTYAHNVKIIVQDGVVTLRGPVRSESEKSNIQAKAVEIVGAAKVRNEITIAPKKG